MIQIAEDDFISRCIIFSRFFHQNIHTDAMLWQFGETKDDGAAHESAVLRRFAQSSNDVHRIGCKIAASQNQNKHNPPPGPKRRYYCGFRTARYGDLPLVDDGYEIVIRHVPEHGEYSHLDVALTVSGSTKSERATHRTNAGLALAECFGHPDAHRCACDLSDDEHPFAKHGTRCLTAAFKDRWPALTFSTDSD
jgi:hypothetical protein